MDIGGIGFGRMPPTSSWRVYIPMLKLIDQGVVNETLMAMIRSNTRLPIDTEATPIRWRAATMSAASVWSR
jgi:N-methylhydantoinase B